MDVELVAVVCSCRCGLVSGYGKTANAFLPISHSDKSRPTNTLADCKLNTFQLVSSYNFTKRCKGVWGGGGYGATLC
jgi:hypothetical protein